MISVGDDARSPSRISRGGKRSDSKCSNKRLRKKATKKMSSARMQIQKQREEDITKLFLAHIHDTKHTPNIIKTCMERLKNPKIAAFDYSDEYSREWFRQIFQINKSLPLNKMNISSD